MTPAQHYIQSLERFKRANGTIDDAISLAKSFLLDDERKHIENAYRTGVHQADGYWAIGKKPMTANEFFTLKYTNNDNTPTT